ncbi:MAG TPA: helix-turn-helix domain-containing protein [Candidatus Angelobacter sp.]|jgi:transcriptional regulator with XRE-family HTH domain|nr:helix-turn-helix domain-containing protein [Candidatus Angelobacter sp.]
MPPADLVALGEFVKQRREERGISRRQLAERSGVPYATLQHLEVANREPRADTLEKIAPLLGLRLADLYTLAGIALPSGLPSLAPLLRTRYGLPQDAIAEAEQHIEELRQRYGVKPRKGGRRGNTAR